MHTPVSNIIATRKGIIALLAMLKGTPISRRRKRGYGGRKRIKRKKRKMERLEGEKAQKRRVWLYLDVVSSRQRIVGCDAHWPVIATEELD